MTNEPQGRRLDSWKEIADYLGRDVRTVIRWEKERSLPVRRLPGGRRQSVFAFTAELDAWLSKQADAPEVSAASAKSTGVAPATVVESAAGPGSSKPRIMIVAAGTGILALLVLLAWLFTSRQRPPDRPAVVATPEQVQFDLPTGSLRFFRSKLETGVNAYRLATADFNHDGALDVAFSASPGDVVGVLLGKGGGSFSPAQLYERCPQSDNITVADFNRDGHPDIAVTCVAADFLVVLWGKGDGTFPNRAEVPIPGGPRFLTVGDLNNDGWPDLVVSSVGEPAQYILRNRAGKFAPERIAALQAVSAPAVADLNQDDYADVIVGGRIQDRSGVGLFFGNKAASFRLSRFISWEGPARSLGFGIEPADFDRDGILDLAIHVWNDQVLISRGVGGGKFAEPVPIPDSGRPDKSGGWRVPAVVDLDLDGKPDIVVPDMRDGTLRLLRGNGDGTFIASRAIPLGGRAVVPTIADVNGDGLPDILVVTFFEPQTILLMAEWKKSGGR